MLRLPSARRRALAQRRLPAFSDQAEAHGGRGSGHVRRSRAGDARRTATRSTRLIKASAPRRTPRQERSMTPWAEGQPQCHSAAPCAGRIRARDRALVGGPRHSAPRPATRRSSKDETVLDESGRKDRGWCARGSSNPRSAKQGGRRRGGPPGASKAVDARTIRYCGRRFKIDRPDPRLAIEASTFRLSTADAGGGQEQRASAPGVGKLVRFRRLQLHVALEEYTGTQARGSAAGRAELLLVSAASTAAAAARCKRAWGSAAARTIADRLRDSQPVRVAVLPT